MTITMPGTVGGSSPIDRARRRPFTGIAGKPYIAIPKPNTPSITLPGGYSGGSSPMPDGSTASSTNSYVPSFPAGVTDWGDIWYGGSNYYNGGGVGDTAQLDALRKERLAAALAAIGAQFDYEEGDLKGQQAALIELFRSGMAENERTAEMTEEGVGDAAAERGLNRSGLYIKELARAMAPIADERADLVRRLNPAEGVEGREAGNAGTEVRAIESLLKLLVQQEAAATAGAELESRQDELDIGQLIALIGGNLSSG